MADFSPTEYALLTTLLPPSLLRAIEQPDPLAATLAEACAIAERALLLRLPFVPPPLAALRLKEPTSAPGGRYTHGTVVVADLGGFAELAAQLIEHGPAGSEQLNQLTQQLFGELGNTIYAYGGGVIGFGGDVLFALFDAATLGADHAWAACAAAQALQRRMLTFDTDRQWGLRLRVGMHSGQMFAVEAGEGNARKLVVTGHTLHRVAVAHEAAGDGEIVVSEATVQALGGVPVEPRGKGFGVLPALPVSERVRPMAHEANLWQPDPPSLTALHTTLHRLAALTPFVPAGLPDTLIEQGKGGTCEPISVLVANVYGFGKLLELIEPLAVLHNDLDLIGRIVRTYYGGVQHVVERFGGTINTVNMAPVGDKFVAVWGAPRAHPDDTLHATQAALALPAALADVNRTILALVRDLIARYPQQRALLRVASIALRQRVGLASGVAFAGIVGTPERHDYTVLGNTVQLATRLMQAAKDGEVVLSPGARASVRHAVETQPLPPLNVPGITEPLAIHRAVQLRPTSGDILPHSAPLVGRDVELAQLQAVGRRALLPNGAGHVVVLVGNPGSGKSRLYAELLQGIRTTLPDVEMIGDACQSYEQTTPYAVWTRLLRTTFAPSFQDGAMSPVEAVARFLDDVVPSWARFGPLLAPLLQLPLPPTELTQALTLEQRRDRLHDLIVELFLALARRQPLVLVVDDLHWADASSRALAQRLAASTHSVPLLLVLPYRPAPDLEEPWRALDHCSALTITELDQNDSETLLAALLQGEPPAALKPLIERTRGTPFFLEETVRYLLDKHALERTAAGRWICVEPDALLMVPSTVEQLITARLDRLQAEQRALLEVAAVVGRRFWAPLLQAVLHSQQPLHAELQALVDASLLEHDHDVAGDDVYRFKHALTRDVAYNGMLLGRKRHTHAQVAGAIERLYATSLNEQHAVLANHYLQADQPEQALPHFVAAAQAAQARYANNEAVTLYRQAITIAQATPLTNAQLLTTLHEQLGDVLTLIGHYDAARGDYERALALLNADVPTSKRALLLRRIAGTFDKQARYDDALHYLAQARDVLGDADGIERANLDADSGWIAFLHGELDDAERLLQGALALAQQHDDGAVQATVLRRLAGVYFRRDDGASAKAILEQSLALSSVLGDAMSAAATSNNLGVVAQQQGDWQAAARYCNEAQAIYTRHGDIRGQMQATLNGAVAAHEQGDLATALAGAAAAFELAQQIGDTFHMALARENQGRSAFFADDNGAARRYMLHAETLYRKTGGHHDDRSLVASFLGRIALRQGKGQVALRQAQRALRLAEQAPEIMALAYGRQLLALAYGHEANWQAADAVLEALHQDPALKNTEYEAMTFVVQALHERWRGMPHAADQAQRAAQRMFAQLAVPAVLQRFI